MTEDARQRVNWYLNILLVVLAFSIPLYRKWVSTAVPLVTILWFVEGRWPEKTAILKRHRLSLAVAAFVTFSALSLAWTADLAEGLDYLEKYRYLLLIPVITTSLRGHFRTLVESWFVAGTVLSVALSGLVFAGVMRIRDAYPGNPSPFMSHLDYSMVLAVAALIALTRAVEESTPAGRRAAWVAAFCLVTGGLLINIGRSGQAAFVVAVIVVIPLVLWQRSPKLAITATAGAVIALAVTYAAVKPFQHRVDAGIHELTTAVHEGRYDTNQGKRVAGAVVALDMIRERPVLGTGIGANMIRFRELLESRHQELSPLVAWFPHLHNQYLQTATETGLVGLVLLLAVFAALVAGPYMDPHDRHVACLLAVIYLVGFLGDPYLHKQLPLVLFATFAGLASARGRSLFWDVTRET